MAITEWQVGAHRVRLGHNSWTGAAEISVDGGVVFARGWVWTDPGFERAINIDGATCLLRVTSARFRYRYELLSDTEPIAPVKARERRRIPASLKIFVVLAVLAGGMSALFVGIRAYRQRVALERMRAFHASVGKTSHWPKWLWDAAGDNWRFLITEVVDVDLSGTQIGNDDLADLEKLPYLRSLSLEGAPFINDAGLAYVQRLTSLRELNLSATQVSDAGLRELSRLPNLEDLGIGGADITDAGLVHLTSLKGLRRLTLWGTKITNEGLTTVAKLAELDSLDLDGTQVTDDGVARLGNLKNLGVLSLADTRVTGKCITHLRAFPDLYWVNFGGTLVDDEGTEDLASLPNLEMLYLQNTRITDTALSPLKRLGKLEFLEVGGTSVTDAGIADLKRALPRVQIKK